MDRDSGRKSSSDKYSKRDYDTSKMDNPHSSYSKRMPGSRPSPPRSLPPQMQSHSNNPSHHYSSTTSSYKPESTSMSQKPYPNQYSSGSTHGTLQNKPQPPDVSLNANLSLAERNEFSRQSAVLPPTNRMDIEPSNSNKASNTSKVQHGQQSSGQKEMQIEMEGSIHLEKEKSTSETPKAKILDPRLRNENNELKKESSHSKDKQLLEDVERFEKILKKLKKEDSTHKRELKRTLEPNELQACLDAINSCKAQLGSKYTEFLRRLNGYLTDNKKIGGNPPQKFEMNYVILQALINSHHDGARSVVQDLTEAIVDLSLENVTHQKNRTVELSKVDESNGTTKTEGQEEQPIKVAYVPATEIYKYNPELKEMEDKMERLEQIIAEKKAKLNQTNQKILKIEIDSHRSKIKNEFLMKFETNLA